MRKPVPENPGGSGGAGEARSGMSRVSVCLARQRVVEC